MKYKIIGYEKSQRMHRLKDEQGRVYLADIAIEGEIADYMSKEFENVSAFSNDSQRTVEDIYAYEASLVGRTIEADYMQPISYIAANVKLLPKND
jgi:hypothetical protein